MTELERNEIARFLNGLAAAAYERQHGRPNMVTILKSDTDHAINLLHEEYFRLTAFERKIKKAAKKAGATTSPAKQVTSAANGKKGGRPRKAHRTA